LFMRQTGVKPYAPGAVSAWFDARAHLATEDAK
jgi:hypothetical protein